MQCEYKLQKVVIHSLQKFGLHCPVWSDPLPIEKPGKTIKRKEVGYLFRNIPQEGRQHRLIEFGNDNEITAPLFGNRPI